jgi:hypothetical protein
MTPGPDPSSQFGYLLANGRTPPANPLGGCGCAVLLFAGVAVLAVLIRASGHG